MKNFNAEISAQIKETVRDIYIQQAHARAEWIMKIREVRQSAEFKAFTDEYQRYGHLAMLGYGKTHINMARSGADWVLERCLKDAEHALLKIDVAVAKRLDKNSNVDSVELLYTNTGKDGFVEGAWKLIDGDKSCKFSFETIYAGGYNIQCLHVRTKYKMTKMG